MTRVALFGDPTKALGSVAEPECALDHRRHRPGRGARLAGRVVRAVVRRQDLDGQRHREHGLGRPARCAGSSSSPRPAARSTSWWPASTSAPSRTGTPRRRCCMHTKGILVMTPDSAMVLTGKQSLDYSGGVVGRGQLRHRRLRPGDGPERAGAVLGAEPGRRRRPAVRPLRAHLPRAGRALAAAGADDRPARPRRARVPAHPPGERLHDRRRHLLRDGQPGAQEAVRHPHGHARRRRPGPPGARALGGDGRRRHRGGVRRPPRRAPGDGDRHRVAARCRAAAASRPTAPTSGPPARCSRGRRRRPPGRSTPASGNRPLVVLANLSGFDGSPESLRNLQLEYGAEIGRAIVNFDGPIVFCVISRYHGGAFVVFSGDAQRQHGGRRRRGLLRLGDRRRAGGRGGVHGEVNKRTTADADGSASWRRAGRGRRRRPGRAAGRAGRAARPGSRSRSSARWRPSSSGSTTSSGRSAVGSVHAIMPAAELRPYLIDAVERGMARAAT